MNIQESKVLLSIDLPANMGCTCVKKITLGPDFISKALNDSGPAYSLKVFSKDVKSREYHKLSDNMKLHLHVKQYVADSLGVDFGGRLDCFKWTVV